MDVLVLIEGVPVEYVFNGPRIEKVLISDSEVQGKVSADGKIDLEPDLALDKPFVWQDSSQNEGKVCLVRYERSNIGQLLIDDGQFFIPKPELTERLQDSITEVSPGVDDGGESFFLVKQNGRLSQVIFTDIETMPVTLNAFDPLPITALEQKVYSIKGEKTKINNREVGNADYVINGTKLPDVLSFNADLILPTTIHQITTNRGTLPFTIKRRSTDNTVISGHPDATWILPDGRMLRGDLVLSGSIKGPVLLAANGGGAGLVVQVVTEEVETLFCGRCQQAYIEPNNYHGACRWHTQHAQTINREMAQNLVSIDKFSTPEIEGQTFAALLKRLPEPAKSIIEVKLAYLSTAQPNRLTLLRSPLDMVVAELRGLIKDYIAASNAEEEPVRRYARVVSHLLDERKLKDCLTLPYYDPNDPDQRVTSGFRNPNKRFGLLGDTWQCCGFSDEQGGCWVGRHASSEFPDLQDAMNDVRGSEWLNETNTSEDSYREIIAAKERGDYETMFVLEGLFNEVQGAVLVVPDNANAKITSFLKEVGAKPKPNTSSYWVRDVIKSLEYDGISTEDLLSRSDFSPVPVETNPVQLIVRPPSPRRKTIKLTPPPQPKKAAPKAQAPPKELTLAEKQDLVVRKQSIIDGFKKTLIDEDWRRSQRLIVKFNFDFTVTVDNIPQAEQIIQDAWKQMLQWEKFKKNSSLDIVSDYQSNVTLFVNYFKSLIEKRGQKIISILPKKAKPTLVEKFMKSQLDGSQFDTNLLLDIGEIELDLLSDWKIQLPSFKPKMEFTHFANYGPMWTHFGYVNSGKNNFEKLIQTLQDQEKFATANFSAEESFDNSLLVWKAFANPDAENLLKLSEYVKLASFEKEFENAKKEAKVILDELDAWPASLKKYQVAREVPTMERSALEQYLVVKREELKRNKNYFDKKRTARLLASFQLLTSELESWKQFLPGLNAARQENLQTLSSKSNTKNFYDEMYDKTKVADVQPYLEGLITDVRDFINQRYPLTDALKLKIQNLEDSPLVKSHLFGAVRNYEEQKQKQFTPEQQKTLETYLNLTKQNFQSRNATLADYLTKIRKYVPDFEPNFSPTVYILSPPIATENFDLYFSRLKNDDSAILRLLDNQADAWKQVLEDKEKVLVDLKTKFEQIIKATPRPELRIFHAKVLDVMMTPPTTNAIELWEAKISEAEKLKTTAEKILSVVPTLQTYASSYFISRDKYTSLKPAQFDQLKNNFEKSGADEVSQQIATMSAQKASEYLLRGLDKGVDSANSALNDGKLDVDQLRKYFIENLTFFTTKPKNDDAEKTFEQAEAIINEMTGDVEGLAIDIPTNIDDDGAAKALEEATEAATTANENKEAVETQIVVNVQETKQKLREIVKTMKDISPTLQLEGFTFIFEGEQLMIASWEELLSKEKSKKFEGAIEDATNDLKNMKANREKCSNDFYAGIGKFRKFAIQFAFVLAVEKLAERPAQTRNAVLKFIEAKEEVASLTYNIVDKKVDSTQLRRRIFGDNTVFIYPDEVPTPTLDVVSSEWAVDMLVKMSTTGSLVKQEDNIKYDDNYKSIVIQVATANSKIYKKNFDASQAKLKKLETQSSSEKKNAELTLITADVWASKAKYAALMRIKNAFSRIGVEPQKNKKTGQTPEKIEDINQVLNMSVRSNSENNPGSSEYFGEYNEKSIDELMPILLPTVGPYFGKRSLNGKTYGRFFKLNAPYVYKGLEAMQLSTLASLTEAEKAVAEYVRVEITLPDREQSFISQIDSRVKQMQEESFFDQALFNSENASAIPEKNVKLNAMRTLSSLLVGSMTDDTGNYQYKINSNRFAIIGMNAVWVLLQALKANDFISTLVELREKDVAISDLALYYKLDKSEGATIFVDVKNGDAYERFLKIEIDQDKYKVTPKFEPDYDSEEVDKYFKTLAQDVKKVNLLAFVMDNKYEVLIKSAIPQLLQFNVLQFGFISQKAGWFASYAGYDVVPYNTLWSSVSKDLKPQQIIPMRLFYIDSSTSAFNNFKPQTLGPSWNDIMWDTAAIRISSPESLPNALDDGTYVDENGLTIRQRWELFLKVKDEGDKYLVGIPSNVQDLPPEQSNEPELPPPPKIPEGTPPKTEGYDFWLNEIQGKSKKFMAKKEQATKLAENIYWNWSETEKKPTFSTTKFVDSPLLRGYPDNYFNNLVWMLTFVEDNLSLEQIKRLASTAEDRWQEPVMESGRRKPDAKEVPKKHANYHENIPIIPLPFPIENFDLLMHYYTLATKYASAQFAIRSTHVTETLEMGSRAERLWNARLADQEAFRSLINTTNTEGLFKITKGKLTLNPVKKLKEFLGENVKASDVDNVVDRVATKKFPNRPSDISDEQAEIVSASLGWNKSVQQKNDMKQFLKDAVLAELPKGLSEENASTLRKEIARKITFEGLEGDAKTFVEYLVLTSITDAKLDILWKKVFRLYNQNTFMNESLWQNADRNSCIYSVVDVKAGDRVAHAITTLNKWEGSLDKVTYPGDIEISKSSLTLCIDEVVVRRRTNVGKILLMKAVLDTIAEGIQEQSLFVWLEPNREISVQFHQENSPQFLEVVEIPKKGLVELYAEWGFKPDFPPQIPLQLTKLKDLNFEKSASGRTDTIQNWILGYLTGAPFDPYANLTEKRRYQPSNLFGNRSGKAGLPGYLDTTVSYYGKPKTGWPKQMVPTYDRDGPVEEEDDNLLFYNVKDAAEFQDTEAITKIRGGLPKDKTDLTSARNPIMGLLFKQRQDGSYAPVEANSFWTWIDEWLPQKKQQLNAAFSAPEPKLISSMQFDPILLQLGYQAAQRLAQMK